MQKIITSLIILSSVISIKAQTDYSSSWEDLYSYNYIVDFVNTDTHIISLSVNALFIYDKQSGESEKISSVNGLSGEQTSALYYDNELDKIVIGYKNGLLEIIDENRTITIKPDILNFDIIGSKHIKDITADGSNLFLSVPFGIVTFDLETDSFGDTYFIGEESSEVHVNEIEIFNNKIYAASEVGVYIAQLDEPYLIDSANWLHIFTDNFSNIETFNNHIYLSNDQGLYRIENDNSLVLVNTQSQIIEDITATNDFISITTEKYVSIYDTDLSLFVQSISNVDDDFPYKATTSRVFENNCYIATTNYGILKSSLSSIESFEEIHPEGPISNSVFSISSSKDHLWVVYGGYDAQFAPLDIKKGASHFNGENWITIPYDENAITERNLVHVSIDPYHENRVYISSFHNGMVIIENDEVIMHWDDTNSALERIPDHNIRISDSVFDEEGNLWITNVGVSNRLKKYSSTGDWSSYDLSSLYINVGYGMNSIVIDMSDNIWMGTQANGAWVVNKDVTKKRAFRTNESMGNLPNRNVRAIAVDDNNQVWMGTREGLVTFSSGTSFFDQATYSAHPVIIESGEDDGFGIALLGIQKINAICVDGANNKWFGTDSSGVLYTNPSGKETYFHFDKSNSPLPSDKILDIQFNEETGKVYFATDMGIVSHDSNIAPYGEHLEEAYVYPNPVKKHHDFVTIDGRYGTHLPNGTNIKILDAAGRLVYETNVVGGQEQYGGKVVWNKTNLAGNKVASGVYMVLLTTKDTSETSMTKIAIIN